MISIKQIMKKDFSQSSPLNSVGSAVEIMEKMNADYLLIEEERKIKGLVTSREIVGYPSSRLILDSVIQPISTISGETLLDEALKGAQGQQAEVEKIVVDKLKITPCREYYGCLKDGNCVIRDDMDNIYPRLLVADSIIVASPMFFYGVTAQLKALIDRCQALWVRRYVLKNLPDSARKGAFIGIGATRGKQLFDGSILTVKYFFQALGVKYVDELLVRGVDKRGEIKEHPTALSDAFSLGQRLVQKIG